MAAADVRLVRIINVSNQMIPIQVSAVNGDFYKDQQQLHLAPGKDMQLDEKYLVSEQVSNLRERGLLRVVSSN